MRVVSRRLVPAGVSWGREMPLQENTFYSTTNPKPEAGDIRYEKRVATQQDRSSSWIPSSSSAKVGNPLGGVSYGVSPFPAARNLLSLPVFNFLLGSPTRSRAATLSLPFSPTLSSDTNFSAASFLDAPVLFCSPRVCQPMPEKNYAFDASDL